MSELMQPATGADPALIKETDTQNFVADVIEESKRQPVMIDFWAPWCGPCRQLTPVIEKAVREARGRVKLVKMNIDDHPEIPGQMGVRSIPAVIAFKNGRPVDGFMGAVPESQIKQFIDKIAGPGGPSAETVHLEEAETLLAAGDFDAAAGHFSAVLQMDETNIAALLGLARCALGLGDRAQAEEILELIPEDKRQEPTVKALKTQLELLAKAAGAGGIETLSAKLEADPNDHPSRFDLALALNASGRREEAANALLEIFRRDRTWNDDGARKELLAFFEAWGAKDPATVAARRKLSSLMFS